MNLQEIGYIFWTTGSVGAETLPVYIAPEQTIATPEGVWRVVETISYKKAHLYLDEEEIEFYGDVDIWLLCVAEDTPVGDWIKPHVRNVKLNDLL